MKALEFYSGLGGLHYALAEACPSSEVVRAFDINDTANDVYQHNFGVRPSQTNIDSLTAQQLDKLGSQIWLLSPPCQPYTRRGLRKHSADDRAASFLNLLRRLREMQRPPMALLLENVVGFEASDTRDVMVSALEDLGFEIGEVIACPTDLGVPYSRPRYFAMARRKDTVRSSFRLSALPFRPVSRDGAVGERPVESGQPSSLASFLVNDLSEELAGGVQVKLDNDIRFKQKRAAEAGSNGKLEPDQNIATAESFSLGADLLLKNGWCLDIVTPSSTRTCCFTKTYGQYVKGSGSVLAPAGKEEAVQHVMEAFPCLIPRANSTAAEAHTQEPSSEELAQALGTLDLRFFTPREIANLHGFPSSFAFPPTVTLRQRYSLLGNSLHVGAVKLLLEHLLSDD